MKTRTSPRSPRSETSPKAGLFLCALAVLALVAVQPAQAATYYWDTNDTTAGFGTAGGTWGTNVYWSTSNAGTVAPTVTSPTTSDDLNFGYTTTGLAAGTVSVNGTVNAKSLTFASGSGAITLSGGTAINLAAASTITVNNTTNTISSEISGAATSLTKAGTGTLILQGVNTYTGATSVTGGLLRIGSGGSLAAGSAVGVSAGAIGGTGTIGGAVTVSSTGGINLADGAVGTLTLGSTLGITGAAAANNLTFDLGNATGTSDMLSVAGTTSVTTPGAAVINLNQFGGTAGRTATTYTLIGGAGTLDATNFAKFSLATTKAFGQTYTLVHDSVTDNGNLQVNAANVTPATPAAFWSGTTSANWNTASNWKDALAGSALAVVPDYQTNVTFSATGGGNLSNQVDADFDINSLNFNMAGVTIASTAAKMLTIEATTANGNTAGNGINSANTSGTNTISAKVGLAGSQTWTVATGGTLAVSGVISDFGAGNSLTKAGGGTLTLSGTNAFSGQLNIENGTLYTTSINNKNANGVLGAGTLVVLGASGQTGRLAIQVDGGVSSDKNFTLATGGTGEIQFGNLGNFDMTNQDRPLTLSGTIGGSGNFVKFGGAAVVLSGNNNYSGTTTINVGPLRLSSANALPGGIGATGGTSALTINGTNPGYGAIVELAFGNFLRGLGTGSDQFQIPGGVSGFGAKGGARQVIVNNDPSFELLWGAASFNPSVLQFGYTVTTDSAITLQNKIDLNAATRTITVITNTATISNDIRTSSGTAGLTKTGGGTLVLSGTNTYNGPTTISAGTLTIGSAGALSNTSQIVLGGTSRLEVNAANVSLAKLVTGGGVPLGTFLRYSQPQAAAGTANGPGTILGTVELNVTNVNPDYTLDFGGSISTFKNLVAATYNSPITISGNPSIDSSTAVFTGGTGMTIGASTAGAKTLFLTGTNTGANTIGGVIGNGSGTVAVTKTNSGSWTLTGANTYSGATTVSAGTLTLSGANGSIGSSAATIAGGTLTISNANAANNGDRLSGSSALTMKGGTFNFNNDASANDFSESAGTLTLIGGANTVAIQQAASGRTSTLTFAGLSRTAGALNFSGAGLGAAVDTRGKITFTSAPAITDGIIGPWATVNGTNYATLDGSNNVVAYGGALTDVTRQSSGTKIIPDSSTADVRIIEGTGGSPANLTLAAATTTIDTLLQSISGGTGAATVAISASETLRVNSINAVPTVGALTLGTVANTGTLTPATAGGDLLLVNSSTNNMTINSVIANNTSASSITKDGSGTLKLSGTNTYSGGTVINAGTVWATTNANLGDTTTAAGITFNGSAGLSCGNNVSSVTVNMGSRPITVNNGAIAGLYHNWADTTITTTGAVTGDGGINWGRDPVVAYGGGSGSVVLNLNSTGNNFTGPITVGMGTENAQGGNSQFNFNSLADSINPITFNFNGGTVYFSYGTGAIANLSLTSRPIDLLNSNTTLRNLNATYTMTLGAVSTSTLGAKTLNLGAGGAGGTVAGAITNGNGTLAVTKSGGGTWTLSGANTYTGQTTISDGGGTLAFQNASSSLPTVSTVWIGGSAGMRLLDDGAGTINLGNNVQVGVQGTGERDGPTFYVGNNGGATTGSTIALGTFDLTYGDWRSTQTVTIDGANGYRLQMGGLIISRRADFGAPQINPNTAPVTIVGTVTMASGKLAGESTAGDTLELMGTATGNLISGAIKDAADYPTNPNAKPLKLTKSGTGTWVLSGVNTYTGATSITGGTLEIGGAGQLGSGAYAGAIAIAAAKTFKYNSSAAQTLSGIIGTTGAAGILVKDGAGTLTLTNANIYTGATTVNAGKLKIDTAGTINTTSSLTINGAIAEFMYNNSTTAFSKPITFTQGTLSGTGKIATAVSVGSNVTLSPGGSPGTLTVNNAIETWAVGGKYAWQLLDATGTAGTGFDLADITGTGYLAVTATSGTFNIVLQTLSSTGPDVQGTPLNWDPNTYYQSWKIASSANAITGWDVDDGLASALFAIDATNFVGAHPTATFSVSKTGNDVYLNYVPEPATLALLAFGGLGLLLGRKRR